jgi:hypothetical protein
LAEIAEAEADLADSEEILVQERCTKQFAQNVAKNAKFHLNLQKASLFIAGIVIPSIKDSNPFA